MNDFLSTFEDVFHETFGLIRHFSSFFIIFLAFSIMFSMFRVWKNFGLLVSSKSCSVGSCSCDQEYDDEIMSLLTDSPTETINQMFDTDKDYLVDYFSEHLADYYPDLFSDEEVYIDV